MPFMHVDITTFVGYELNLSIKGWSYFLVIIGHGIGVLKTMCRWPPFCDLDIGFGLLRQSINHLLDLHFL